MKQIVLGNSALKVSNIGLGAINFGTKTSEETAFQLLNRYSELGGNFIDTANNYAVWNGGSGDESEIVIGRWLTDVHNRTGIKVATKLGARPAHAGSGGFSNMQGLGRDTILRSVEQSLKNLRTDYIDLLYLHVDDFGTPQYEVLATLNQLIREGTVREIGCSNFKTWRIESARTIAAEHGFRFFCAVQQRYSYLNPVMDYDLLVQIPVNPELTSYLSHYKDLTLVAYSPLMKGQYSSPDILKQEYRTDINRIKLAQLLEEQEHPNKWVLDYVTNSFGGSAALVTTSSTAHLEELLQ